MTPYIFIGFSGNFGDFADIVHACGGYVRKVVVNLPTDTMLGAKTFDERLANYREFVRSRGIAETVELEHLRHFKPTSADRHVLAARGLALLPLQRYLMDVLGILPEPLVHPTAILSPTVTLPGGVIIRAAAVIGSGAILGPFSTIGTSAYIGHDCELADNTTVNPNASLASFTKLQQGARVGIGATIINESTLGEQCFVAAGAVVTQDVPPCTLVAGVPAVVKKHLPPQLIADVVAGLEDIF